MFNIQNCSINIDKYAQIPDYINDYDECVVYSTQVVIDVTSSELLDQKLVNYLLNLNFKFNVNTDAINNQLISVEQLELDEFINELRLSRLSTSINFSNYQNTIKKTGYLDFVDEYYFDSNQGQSTTNQIIYYQQNTCENLSCPISKLLTIYADCDYVIDSYLINFYYSCKGSQEINNLSYENDEKIYVNKIYELFYLNRNSFKFDSKTLNSDATGISGFYLPISSSGY